MQIKTTIFCAGEACVCASIIQIRESATKEEVQEIRESRARLNI